MKPTRSRSTSLLILLLGVFLLAVFLISGPAAFAGDTQAAEDAPASEDATAEDASFDPAGDWQGTLTVPGADLRLVFHITRTDDGLSTTVDSIDQGTNSIPTSSTTFKNGKLHVKLPAIGGSYKAKLKDDGTFSGTWSQGGANLRLDLERQTEKLELKRPQEPKEPFPYHSEVVTFPSAESGGAEGDDVVLAGTLTRPKGDGPFPAAILISGSGPQDRDESLMGHRPFFVLADHLTRQGIAVLRYDDRGTAESTGNFSTATSLDFSFDTLGAVRFLKEQKKIGPIGLIGHSEGGLIAPMVAAGDDDVAFVVLLAGPGTTGKEILLDQTGLLYQGRGTVQARLDELRKLQIHVYDRIMVGDIDEDALKGALKELIDFQSGGTLSDKDMKTQIDGSFQTLTSPWFRFFLGHDPATMLEGVEQPVLALNGEKDIQVPAERNLKAIADALKKAGNTNFETESMPGLNHLFQTADTGLPDEYAKIEETFAPVALNRISEWILKHAQKADSPK